MSFKHFFGLFVCIVGLGILGFSSLVGCSSFDSGGKRPSGATDEDVFELRVSGIVRDLNDASNNYSIHVEGEGYGTYIQIEESFDKNLDSICKNYSLSTSGTETVTAEQVRNALTDNISQLIEKSKSDNWEGYLIYKVFEWCGTSCKETAIYVEGAGFNQAEWERWVSSSSATNYAIVDMQTTCLETGKPYEAKFKWQ